MSDCKRPTIVGVGASAGGLEAFKLLLEGAEPGQGLAFVLVQHLDPTHESMMAELLAKMTPLTVREIADDDVVEADNVYVIPPGRYVHLEGEHLRLSRPTDSRGSRIAVDELFRSLAEQCGRSAVGVVLSGTGTDGTAGMRSIKAAGGLCVAQAPATAGHAGMPASVVEQELADFVLKPSEIADAIRRFVEHPYVQEDRETPGSNGQEGAEAEEIATGRIRQAGARDGGGDRDGADRGTTTGMGLGVDFDEEAYDQVLALVKTKLGVELSAYKHSSLLRRIQRRMGLRQLHELARYVEVLEKDDTELEQLAREVYINVTDFFRDAEAFEVLEDRALPELFARAAQSGRGELRAWIPGCATGEEAYSVAIALYEARERLPDHKKINLQVFATDVDEDAVQFARAGLYPQVSMGGVSSERLKRFFHQQEEQPRYRVRQFLRDMVSFARHDLLGDPPFSRIDLVSCRNLLIYFRRSAQAQAIETFHFSLRRQGFVLLGPSESLGDGSSLFRAVDTKWRLYERLDAARRANQLPFSTFKTRSSVSESDPSPEQGKRPGSREVSGAAHRLIVQAVAPPTVVINEAFEVLYLHGELVEFLDLPRGVGEMSMVDMLRREVRTRVRAAIYRAAREAELVTTSGKMRRRDGQSVGYTVTVRPCESRELGDRLLIVVFQINELAGETEVELTGGVDAVTSELERELQATRDDLRSTVEALENANEELRTSNEEAMTVNEELQSTNEELETQSEELRSVNEELITVNAQLREKVEQVQEAHADIANLLTSTKLPAVFLDREFCIRRYTPEAQKLLNVIETDMGRPIRDLAGVCAQDGMLDDAKDVLDGLAPVEKEIQTPEGEWYLRRILPYRTDDDRIAGVVVTFSAVTRLKRLTAEQTKQREQQTAVVELGLRALREPDFEKIADQTCTMLSEILRCELVKVLRLTDEGDAMRLAYGLGWDTGIVGEATVPSSEVSQAGYTLQQTGPVVVEDLESETRFQGPDLLLNHGVVSGMSVIIHGPERAFGVLGVHCRERRVFADMDVDFLQQVATLLGAAWQRHTVEHALRQSELTERQTRERLQLAKEAADLGIHRWDTQSNQVDWDQRVRELWGADSDEAITYETFMAGLHPDDRERTESAVQAALSPDNDGRYYAEYRVIHRHTGQTAWVGATGLVAFEDGQPASMIGTVEDITAQKENELHLRTMMGELNHRVKNTVATIDAIAQQAGSQATDIKTFLRSFSERLRSIGSAHSLLTREDWRGANLHDVIRAEVEPRIGEPTQLVIEGPSVVLKPKAALAVHMAIHELATNAAKYGALSVPDGRVRIDWSVSEPATDGAPQHVELEWIEEEGPPVTKPDEAGFGSTMIEDLLTYELRGSFHRRFDANGLCCKLSFPLQGVYSAAPTHVRRVPRGQAGVLVVEDGYALAQSLSQLIEDHGHNTLGPVGTIEDALALIKRTRPTAAVLDVDLDGRLSYPVAEVLRERGVPFVFATGFNLRDLPGDYADVPVLAKPVDEKVLRDWLVELELPGR